MSNLEIGIFVLILIAASYMFYVQLRAKANFVPFFPTASETQPTVRSYADLNNNSSDFQYTDSVTYADSRTYNPFFQNEIIPDILANYPGSKIIL